MAQITVEELPRLLAQEIIPNGSIVEFTSRRDDTVHRFVVSGSDLIPTTDLNERVRVEDLLRDGDMDYSFVEFSATGSTGNGDVDHAVALLENILLDRHAEVIRSKMNQKSLEDNLRRLVEHEFLYQDDYCSNEDQGIVDLAGVEGAIQELSTATPCIHTFHSPGEELEVSVYLPCGDQEVVLFHHELSREDLDHFACMEHLAYWIQVHTGLNVEVGNITVALTIEEVNALLEPTHYAHQYGVRSWEVGKLLQRKMYEQGVKFFPGMSNPAGDRELAKYMESIKSQVTGLHYAIYPHTPIMDSNLEIHAEVLYVNSGDRNPEKKSAAEGEFTRIVEGALDKDAYRGVSILRDEVMRSVAREYIRLFLNWVDDQEIRSVDRAHRALVENRDIFLDEAIRLGTCDEYEDPRGFVESVLRTEWVDDYIHTVMGKRLDKSGDMDLVVSTLESCLDLELRDRALGVSPKFLELLEQKRS